MTYEFKGNKVTHLESDETWEIDISERCDVVVGGGEEYLLTDEYVFNANIPLVHINDKLQAKFVDPATFELLGDGYVGDGKMVFLRENYICSAFGARYLGSGYLATNTKIYHWGIEQTFLVKKLGCNPKSTIVVEENILRDEKATFENINAWREPWAVINHNV